MKQLRIAIVLLCALCVSAVRLPAQEEALKEVDALLKEASRITGMPIKHPVKSAVAKREEVQKYIRGQVVDNERQLHFEEVALKKFGLLPQDYSMQDALVKLLTEQAAAFYDPKQKKIFIADWTPIAMQRPAIIHELTHALQDQQVDLEKFLDDSKMDDDEQAAHDCVVEGGGVLAMMDYMLAGTGVKLDAIPDLQEMVTQATLAEIDKFPVYAAAPLYLRETLLFPYTAGMQYVHTLVQKDGKAGYGESLKTPPHTTAEVLHPGRIVKLAGPEMQAPEVSPLPAGFTLLGKGTFGELDLRILLKQYLSEEVANKIAPEWRGFRFAIYEDSAHNAAFLVHRSRWSDAAAAAGFAGAYRKVLAAKGETNFTLDIDGSTVTIREGMPKP